MHALRLLAGDEHAFATEVWGTGPHLHHASDPRERTRLTGLLTLDDVDHLLTGTTVRAPEIRLARDGDVLPTGDWTQRASLAGRTVTGLADPRRLLEQFDEGATIVLQGLQRSWPPLADLLGELEHELGHPCQANAYLTPPSSRGFARHHDAHDVFVVQTHGTKAWQVHDADGHHDLVLEPGTSLYLPAGTDHRAETRSGTSLHVTIGIRQVPRRRLLERAVRTALDQVTADERLPVGWHHDPAEVVPDLHAALAGVADALGQQDPLEVLDDEITRFRTSRTTAVPGALRDRVALDTLDDTTRVVRRTGHHASLRDDGDEVRVLLGDREVRVPGWVRPALEALVGRDELFPADLATWLDPDSRVVLVRRLVREGLFRIAP